MFLSNQFALAEGSGAPVPTSSPMNREVQPPSTALMPDPGLLGRFVQETTGQSRVLRTSKVRGSWEEVDASRHRNKWACTVFFGFQGRSTLKAESLHVPADLSYQR